MGRSNSICRLVLVLLPEPVLDLSKSSHIVEIPKPDRVSGFPADMAAGDFIDAAVHQARGAWFAAAAGCYVDTCTWIHSTWLRFTVSNDETEEQLRPSFVPSL
jgi:hypothetical protein